MNHMLQDQPKSKPLSQSSVDFMVDEGRLILSSIGLDSRAGDVNEVGESSIEVAFEPVQEAKIKPDLSCGDIGLVNGKCEVAEPYMGQEFESEAAAHMFYNAYATHVGFVIRVSKLSRSRCDGTAIGRALVCNKEGFRMPNKREKIMRQRAETRVGCHAMILIRKMTSGKWVLTKFVKEHTHELAPGKGRRDLLHHQYPNEHDKIRELSQQLAAEKKRAAAYKRHLEMLFEYIEEHNESLSNNIQNIVESIKSMESTERQGYR